jgi:hypothetical protein
MDFANAVRDVLGLEPLPHTGKKEKRPYKTREERDTIRFHQSAFAFVFEGDTKRGTDSVFWSEGSGGTEENHVWLNTADRKGSFQWLREGGRGRRRG